MDVTSASEEDVADIPPQASNPAGLEGRKQVSKPAKRRRFTGPRFTSKRQLKSMRRDSEKNRLGVLHCMPVMCVCHVTRGKNASLCRSNISNSQQGKGGFCEDRISTSSPEEFVFQNSPVEKDMPESSTHSESEETRNTTKPELKEEARQLETRLRSSNARLSSKVGRISIAVRAQVAFDTSNNVKRHLSAEAATCKCCRRRFNSRHALHIHIGMNSRCKTAIWAKVC